MNDEAPQGKPSPEPIVYGMDMADVLTRVWFSGFGSGASAACGIFLPDDAADAKAEDLVREASGSPEFCARLRVEIHEQLHELMAQVMAQGQPMATGAVAAQIKTRLTPSATETPER